MNEASLCSLVSLPLTVDGPSQSAQAAGKKLKLAFVTNNASDFWTTGYMHW